ncbi:RNA polymerase sigma factor [Lysinibacillus parviboronicapiens]|uniref:RNA polymerase sigma factor n=1 Tax=Lysinibacillus parviboronicapiens TaxID=436516 RepID=UPI0023792EC7|nr:sigma factor-like helix-turn-helix DNA-binding protein [Lysinibacillus parviboronicapiens]
MQVSSRVKHFYYFHCLLDREQFKQREVLIYFYFEEMPVVEIAQLLNIPESTVKTRLRRGRELLKPKLEHIEWEVLLHE